MNFLALSDDWFVIFFPTMLNAKVIILLAKHLFA